MVLKVYKEVEICRSNYLLFNLPPLDYDISIKAGEFFCGSSFTLDDIQRLCDVGNLATKLQMLQDKFCSKCIYIVGDLKNLIKYTNSTLMIVLLDQRIVDRISLVKELLYYKSEN